MIMRCCIAALIKTEPDMQVVAEAATGQEAIAEFRKHRPDITLIEVQMPGISGIECSRYPQGVF
jgi:DNA-binding NarL/FixJ family response regulator